MKRGKSLLGIALVAVGIIGFVVGTENRKGHRIDGATGSGIVSFQMQVEPPHTYRVSFSIEAEKGESLPGFATAEGEVAVHLDGDVVTSRTLAATSSGDARGGVKRAIQTAEIDVSPEKPGLLRVKGSLRQGDRWTLDLYRDLGTGGDLAPGLFLLVGVVGLVLFLRSRAKG